MNEGTVRHTQEEMELVATDPQGRQYNFWATGVWIVDFRVAGGEVDQIWPDLIECRAWVNSNDIESGLIQVGLDEIISDYVPAGSRISGGDAVADVGEYAGLDDGDHFQEEQMVEIRPRRWEVVAIDKALDDSSIDFENADYGSY